MATVHVDLPEGEPVLAPPLVAISGCPAWVAAYRPRRADALAGFAPFTARASFVSEVNIDVLPHLRVWFPLINVEGTHFEAEITLDTHRSAGFAVPG